MEKKPGIKTTEFWLGLIGGVVVTGALAGLEAMGISVSVETVIGMVAAWFPGGIYIGARGWIKGKAAAAAATSPAGSNG